MNGEQAAPGPVNLKSIVSFVVRELKPKGKVLTPINMITAPLITLGVGLMLYRLVFGLGAIGGGSQEFPLGIWIGLVVMVGVAFAAGAYVLCFAVYVLNAEKYRLIIRIAVLNGFLAYMFYASAIFLDLGRWWNILNPIIGNHFGVNSVLFLVAWKFFIYMMAAFVEFSPAIAEWLNLYKIRKILGGMTLAAVVFGITLSTLHQSGLGALFMMAKGKVHPLWYSEIIPVLVFVSSIFAGLSVTIFVEGISRKVFRNQLDSDYFKNGDSVIVGLARACAAAMFAYLFLKLLVLVHDDNFALLMTPMGAWYILEVGGLVAIPFAMFMRGARTWNIPMIRAASLVTMAGIVLNRLNYVMITFKWYLPAHEKHFPSWPEIVITLTIVSLHIWVFRWIVHRMPVLRKPPQWAMNLDSH